MTAGPDGSQSTPDRPGTAFERHRESALRESWRGPGWRMFGGCAADVHKVRDWITGVVSRYGCPADPGDAALVVSELFTNAVVHGPAGGRVLVGYCLWPGGLRIVVCDEGGAGQPRLGDPGKLAEGGRGLLVVDAVAADWGSFRIGQVQAVWCDLGKPLDAVPAEAWAWLRPLIAAVGFSLGRHSAVRPADPPGCSEHEPAPDRRAGLTDVANRLLAGAALVGPSGRGCQQIVGIAC